MTGSDEVLGHVCEVMLAFGFEHILNLILQKALLHGLVHQGFYVPCLVTDYILLLLTYFFLQLQIRLLLAVYLLLDLTLNRCDRVQLLQPEACHAPSRSSTEIRRPTHRSIIRHLSR